MKLLLCTACNDVVKFGPPMEWRYCACRHSAARYLEDGHSAEIAGDEALAIGVDNHTVRQGVKAQRAGRHAQPRLDAWLFDREYYRIRRVPSVDAAPAPPARRKMTPLDVLDV